jgi:two-component system sensor histidine kinase HydH
MNSTGRAFHFPSGRCTTRLAVLRRFLPLLTIALGFVIGLLLASMNHILPQARVEHGPTAWVIVFVDWIAPPLAGTLFAGALLYAQRARRLQAAERAAAEVLAERLAGTERRQAIWVVAAGVAHDLKNPLHNLQLLVEELGEESSAARRAELLARLRENLLRATERLGDLSRAGQGPLDSPASAIDLADALDDLRDRLAPAALASRTTVEIVCPRGLAIRGDALALRSAMENVAANALEALLRRGGGGRLRLTAARTQEVVELLVEDDGPGIDEPLRARLFTPFASGHQGTGLGLAIARALARAGGGDLVCIEPGPPSSAKTVFRFSFPAA